MSDSATLVLFEKRVFACEVAKYNPSKKARVLKDACGAPAARWCVGLYEGCFYACAQHVPKEGFVTTQIREIV
jgi:hypothetical protein